MNQNAPLRRTQEERSARTVDALRAATVALMVEVGYVNTTTDRISKRAGVSRGALLHHFADKTDLVIDATGAMWDSSVAATRQMSASFAAGEIDLAAFIDGLWSRSFSETSVSVTIDMIIAARADARLAAHLSEALEGRLFAAYAEAADVMFAGADLSADQRRVAMTMATSLIRGLRVADMMQADPALIAAVRGSLVGMLTTILHSKGAFLQLPVAEAFE
ncbi:MAG: AcrR family transcriptional regulator [Pseudorhodobacter sp.]|jgi:AcrR family transcriptional regulator